WRRREAFFMTRRKENKRKCGAQTRSGRPCRSWALPESEPPRCSVHGNGAPPAERQCVATTKAGGRCRAWAMLGQELCSRHAGRLTITGEDRRAGRACTALTRAGEPCRNWAVEDSMALFGRALCPAHAGMLSPAQLAEATGRSTAGRRCEALTRSGEQCGRWATLDTRGQPDGEGQALCHTHAGRFQLPGPGDSRCQAQTKTNGQCPNWAVAGTEAQYGRLLCAVHLPDGDERRPYSGALREGSQRCTAIKWDGTRCRSRALRTEEGAQAGLCWIHAFPQKHPTVLHGYYRRTAHFSDEAHAAIARAAREGEPMEAELMIMRLKLRDVLKYVRDNDVSGWRLDAAASVAYRGLGTVMNLMRARRRMMEIQWKPTAVRGPGALLDAILEEDDEEVNR
ncbi:MAG: hypothetical protein ACOC9Z_03120, partial [Chloroflexota bacterium]